MPRDLDLIKEKLDLVDFLRGYLTLYPAGRNFKALCPFHQEKTPSFIVSPERKIWHCFGCNLGGDVVGFVMRYENMEFPEALRFLAEKAGLQIRTLNPALEREFGVLYHLHEAASLFFKEELLKNNLARDYLKERGLEEKTIEEFGLGFAPGGDALTLHLINKGFDVADIQRAGLAHKNLKGLYKDRFAGRIMFPIENHLGKVVAFTGRLLENPGENSEQSFDVAKERPKYLNSPDTPIFNKSKILYGLHKSKQAILEARTVYLVEGQMDFLMAWQSGILNCVAVSGTGLTRQHLERLRRLADTVILNFDNDEAGLKALERALDIFSGFDFHVKVADLGSYKDPAEAAQQEPLFLKQAIDWARPAFSFLFRSYFSGDAGVRSIPDQKRVLRHLLSKIKNIRSAVEQSIWIKELANISRIREDALLAELRDLPASAPEKSEGEATVLDNVERIERIAARLVSLSLAHDKYLPLLKEKSRFLPAAYQDVLSGSNTPQAEFLNLKSTFEFSEKDESAIEREFNDLIRHLELEFLKKERMRLQEKILLLRENSSGEEIERIMKPFDEISKRINDLSSAV